MLVNNCREAVAGQLQQVLANLYSRLGEIGHYMFLYCVSGRGGETVCLAAMLNKDFFREVKLHSGSFIIGRDRLFTLAAINLLS